MWRVIGIFLCLAGCTNEPGALMLTIIPERPEFATDEPILLHAVLIAGRNPVCLSNHYRFSAELTPVDVPDQVLPSTDVYFRCGTEMLAALIVSPVVLPASLLDVADASRRFDVIKNGQERMSRIALKRSASSEEDSLQIYHLRAGKKPTRLSHVWDPGMFVIRLKLDNEHPGIFPPPLFWKPYDQPVEAETTIRIVECDKPSEALPSR